MSRNLTPTGRWASCRPPVRTTPLESQSPHAARPPTLRTCWRHRLVMAAALAGCLLAAGCGQSNKTTTHNPNTGGSVTTPSTTTAGSGAGAGATPSNYNPSGRPGLTSRAQYDTTSELPASTGPAKSTATVSVLRLDSGTEAGLVSAFDTYLGMPKTCTAQTVPGAVWIAKVKATGASFAIAGFQPAPSCRISMDGQTIPPNRYGRFGILPPPPAGLFERQPDGKWVMNVETGKPFPCPPHTVTGAAPGDGSPVVPKDVLDAWHIPYYSSTCVTTVPRPPA